MKARRAPPLYYIFQPPTRFIIYSYGILIFLSFTDHIGGHINGSQHVPSRTLDHAIPSLVHKLKDKDTVVFHCALSQQRGPSAALGYLRARERLLGSYTQTTVGEAMKKNKEENQEKEEGREEKEEEKEWEDVPAKENKERTQKVYVLENGFVGWQETYGTDERLTTAYNKELWKDGEAWM
jgi:rhodanese-related sulfurtransferase